jgi:dihydroorotase
LEDRAPDVVFRAATIAAGEREVVADVAVRAGVIERIEPSIGASAATEVRCEGLALLPGAVDLHAHLREPGATHKEDIESGTAAAVAGGVTTVLDMPNTNPPTTTAEELSRKVAMARRSSRCNLLFYMALTAGNLGEIEKGRGQPGFAGVKVFLGSTTGEILLADLSALDRALAAVPALFVFHAELESVLSRHRNDMEDPDATAHHVLRPAEAVTEGALLVAELARTPGRRLHLCHVSAAPELDMVADSQGTGLTCEVTPHHLFFTADDTALKGNLLKTNPPVRYARDREALRAALAGGGINAVASDHAPHTLEEKRRPYREAPSGVPGLDTMVPAVLRLVQLGELTLPRAVEVLSAGPARIAGLHRKGRVEEGADADLALYDLRSTWTPVNGDIRSRCGWTPFEGMTLGPRPIGVWVGGRKASGPSDV